MDGYNDQSLSKSVSRCTLIVLHSAAVLYRAVEPLYEDSSGTIAALDSLPETVEALTQITEALDDIEGLLGTSSPSHMSLLLPHSLPGWDCCFSTEPVVP